MLKSSKFSSLAQIGGGIMKIYDFNGKKNLCGERVYQARKKLKISQTQLAARLQVAGLNLERDSISRIEIGTRFVADYEIAVLCKVLDVTPEYLLGLDENKA